jgi:uroporphyrinogen III methyltransferase/synthase
VDQGVVIAAIGPVTANTLGAYGFSVGIQPEDYTVPALAEAVAKGLSAS